MLSTKIIILAKTHSIYEFHILCPVRYTGQFIACSRKFLCKPIELNNGINSLPNVQLLSNAVIAYKKRP